MWTRATRSHASPDPTAGNQVVVKEPLRRRAIRFHSKRREDTGQQRPGRIGAVTSPGPTEARRLQNTAALTRKAVTRVGKGHLYWNTRGASGAGGSREPDYRLMVPQIGIGGRGQWPLVPFPLQPYPNALTWGGELE